MRVAVGLNGGLQEKASAEEDEMDAKLVLPLELRG